MAVRTIKVTVNSAIGVDTAFLFPGSVPHVVTTLIDGALESFGYRAVSNGSISPYYPVRLGTHFKIEFFGDLPIVGNDLGGISTRWHVQDEFDNSRSILASVDLVAGVGTFEIRVPSASALTLDSLVSNLLSEGMDARVNLTGNTGNDTLRGSFWNDTLDGKAGADVMIGGDGNDTYWIDNVGDKVVEAARNGTHDRIYTKFSTTLATNIEDAAATGTGNITFVGNASGNSLSGNAGVNNLSGLGGNDLLAGADGHDILSGGAGQDFFMFVTAPSSSNWDTIKDFTAGDHLMISQYTHIGLTTYPGTPAVPSYSPLAPAAFHAGKSGKAHDSSDRIVYDTDGGQLYFDADGNGPGAAKLIAVLSNHPTLHYYDILIL